MEIKKRIVYGFKKNILSILFSLFLLFLIIFSQANLFAAKTGLTLWAKNVVPSLFPFFIATELLNYTNVPYYLGKLTNRFMRPLFNVPRRRKLCIYYGNNKWLSCWCKNC